MSHYSLPQKYNLSIRLRYQQCSQMTAWLHVFRLTLVLLRYSSKMERMKEKSWSWTNWTTGAAARGRSRSHSVLLETLQPPATSSWCPTGPTLAPLPHLLRRPRRARDQKGMEILPRRLWGIRLLLWPYVMARLRPLWKPWARGRSPSRRRRRPLRCYPSSLVSLFIIFFSF